MPIESCPEATLQGRKIDRRGVLEDSCALALRLSSFVGDFGGGVLATSNSIVVRGSMSTFCVNFATR